MDSIVNISEIIMGYRVYFWNNTLTHLVLATRCPDNYSDQANIWRNYFFNEREFPFFCTLFLIHNYQFTHLKWEIFYSLSKMIKLLPSFNKDHAADIRTLVRDQMNTYIPTIWRLIVYTLDAYETQCIIIFSYYLLNLSKVSSGTDLTWTIVHICMTR